MRRRLVDVLMRSFVIRMIFIKGLKAAAIF